MKKLTNLLIALFTFSTVFGGEFETKVEPFKSVTVMGNFKVNMIQSDHESVTVINNDAEVEDDKFIIDVKGTELIIKIKGDVYKERNIEVIIYYKKVKEINSKRGIWLVVQDTIVQDDLILKCTNGGKIKAEVKCETVDLHISSGGSIKITGEVDIAEYRISTGGTIGAVNTQANTVFARISTGGEIICSVKNKLDININTGGTVSYKGQPEEYAEKIVLGGKIEKLKD